MNTVDKIKLVLTHIENNYPSSPFEYKEIKPIIVNMEYAFTCLCNAGVLKRLSSGRYELVKDSYIDPETIHKLSLIAAENKRKEASQPKNELPLAIDFTKSPEPGILLTSNDDFYMTKEKAIAFLKDLGFKVLEPVKEFREV